MTTKVCCCLCFSPCYNYKLMQNDKGESTEVYDITVKYFDPIMVCMILSEEQSGKIESSTKVLCSNCWTHINDFHDFQLEVHKTRTEMLMLVQGPSKEFVSEDEFSDRGGMEGNETDSDIDDIPLTKLFNNETLLHKPIKKQAEDEKALLLNTDNDSKEEKVSSLENNGNINFDKVEVNSTLETKEEKNAILSEFKEEDAMDSNFESEVKSPAINTPENDIDISEMVCDSENTIKKSRRGRKSKNEINSETAKGKPSVRKLKSSKDKNKMEKSHKKGKDPKRTSYMDKCRENDAFIAQWKPNLDCDLCTATATNFNTLREHFREEHQTRCYIKCCDRKFYRRCVLMDHIRLHINPETHKCDICGRSSTTKHNLKLHKQVMHGNLNQFECEVCHRLFNQKPTLDRHMLTHVKGENKFFCKECGKGYVLELQLNSHIKTVHGVDCVCDQCGRTFHGVNALKKHLLDHAGVPKRKYPCDICGAQLNTNNNLRRHKAAYHHDGTTAYICSICGKVSSSENALRAHKKRVHEENRKHKCTYCEKAFKRPKDLREHIATHTGVDLYQCPHCPQTFKVSANMHHHRKRAHPIEWEEARKNRLQLPKVNILEVTNQIVM
ncbi:transcription factor grauzone isoform X1 [Musca domestica]|uniref:Transcription factor grauzone isoform X1 n=1 Tax=Musca domestica TaxID=7370 RepID=A0A9J7ICC3_MUSDO|nr:transcription factor grauzone isoform X1 [Musca domestica]